MDKKSDSTTTDTFSLNASRKKRIRNFVKQEDDILLVVAEKYLDVLLNKHTNNQIRNEKNKVWHEIKMKFNSMSTFEPRSIDDLKMRWDNMKKYNKRIDGSRPSDYKTEDEITNEALRQKLDALEKATDGASIVELPTPLKFTRIEMPDLMSLDDCATNTNDMSDSTSPFHRISPAACSSSEMDGSSEVEWGKGDSSENGHNDHPVVKMKCKRPLESAMSDELAKYLKRKSKLEQDYMFLVKNRLLEKWEMDAQDRDRRLVQEEEDVKLRRKYATDEERRKVELHAMQMQLLKAKLDNITQKK